MSGYHKPPFYPPPERGPPPWPPPLANRDGGIQVKQPPPTPPTRDVQASDVKGKGKHAASAADRREEEMYEFSAGMYTTVCGLCEYTAHMHKRVEKLEAELAAVRKDNAQLAMVAKAQLAMEVKVAIKKADEDATERVKTAIAAKAKHPEVSNQGKPDFVDISGGDAAGVDHPTPESDISCESWVKPDGISAKDIEAGKSYVKAGNRS